MKMDSSIAQESMKSSLPTGDGKRRRLYAQPITCLRCGITVQPTAHKQKFCSRSCGAKAKVESLKRPDVCCAVCQTAFHPKYNGQETCSRKCSAIKRSSVPEWRAQRGKILHINPRPPKTSIQRKASAERMRSNNPMANHATREKMRQSLSGRTFLARGGNGKTTVQQQKVSDALGLPMEHSIGIPASIRVLFQSPPKCYHVDIACPQVRLAVEIDGKTHLQKKWKFFDRRKEEILAHLGWSVLRFWNQEVDSNLNGVVATVRSTILRLKERTATSQKACSSTTA